MPTTITLTPAIVLGVCLIVATMMRASGKTIAVFAVLFGLAIANSRIAQPGHEVNRSITHVAGEGINVANDELGGGTGKGTGQADPPAVQANR